MSRLLIRTAVAAVAIATMAAPAFAHVNPPPGGGCRLIRGAQTPDPADDVSVCRQDVYFHQGSAPLGNLAAAEGTALPSWDTTRPEGGLEEAGVYVASSEIDIADAGNPAGRPQFAGTFTGPLDTLAFRMYLRSPAEEVLSGSINAVAYLEIDGEVIHDNTPIAGIPLSIVAEENLYRLDAVFRNIYANMESLGLDLSSTKEHTIKLGIVSWSGFSEGALIYDADEAAAGIFFNLEPTSMAGFTKIDLTV